MSKFEPVVGEPPAVQYFGVERLQIDRAYQRTVASHASQRLIGAIAAKWDWRLCTPLLVASRDGGHYIIDGQHRWEAAKMRGDIPFLPCAVGNYTGSAEEAALFVAANRHRVRVNPIDMWRAAAAAHDTATIKLEVMLAKAGLAIASAPHTHSLKVGQLLCTKALYSTLRIHGDTVVENTLASIGKAFGDQVIKHGGLLFAAIAGVYAVPPVPLDRELLHEALASQSADEWTDHPALTGKLGARARGQALRQVMLELMDMIAGANAEEEDQDQAA